MPPMPADFAVRLAGGVAAMLLLTPVRLVPPAFFRTLALVVLGLFVTAALTSNGAARSGVLVGTIAGAILAYLASALWGLGLPRVAAPLTALILFVSSGLLAAFSMPTTGAFGGIAAADLASRLASAALMGSTLTAMLLGHHYLTAPAMSIEPLKRFVVAMGITLVVRLLLAAAGLAIVLRAGAAGRIGWLFLGMRWGMGALGPAVATVLSWQTVRIRSTQSATGILYIAMTLVLFGELAGMILGRTAGVEL